MIVTIFGPNLPDQSLGQFHVHPKDSQAAIRMGSRGGQIIERFNEDVECIQDIVECCYSDQIAESGENWKAYLPDFHIHAAISANLPQEKAEEPQDKDAILGKEMTNMIEALAEELKIAEINSTGYADMYRDDLRRAIGSIKRVRRYYGEPNADDK